MWELNDTEGQAYIDHLGTVALEQRCARFLYCRLCFHFSCVCGLTGDDVTTMCACVCVEQQAKDNDSAVSNCRRQRSACRYGGR